MANHPLLDQLDITLRDVVPGQPVASTGGWSSLARRTYKTEAQLGTGSGPFADVVDVRWRGTLTGAEAIGGMAFLLTAGNLYWTKAPEISLALPVDISLHAYAQEDAGRASFTAGVAGAYLPGVAVCGSSDLTEACTVEEGIVKTGRVSCLARSNSAAVFVLLFPRPVLKVGRKRLWRLRDEVAASLPAGVRDVLTRGRTGSVPSPAV